MNHVASIIGLSLPAFSARQVVNRCATQDVSVLACIHEVESATSCRLIYSQDSLLLLRKENDKLDDDTASTMSLSDSGDLSFHETGVSFAEELVTEVHYRPYTTAAEKFDLYYSEYDYLEFRRECFTGKRRNRVVKFANEIVSEVHSIPPVESKEEAFYTQGELQKFLDEFISSLDR